MTVYSCHDCLGSVPAGEALLRSISFQPGGLLPRLLGAEPPRRGPRSPPQPRGRLALRRRGLSDASPVTRVTESAARLPPSHALLEQTRAISGVTNGDRDGGFDHEQHLPRLPEHRAGRGGRHPDGHVPAGGVLPSLLGRASTPTGRSSCRCRARAARTRRAAGTPGAAPAGGPPSPVGTATPGLPQSFLTRGCSDLNTEGASLSITCQGAPVMNHICRDCLEDVGHGDAILRSVSFQVVAYCRTLLAGEPRRMVVPAPRRSADESADAAHSA